METGTRQFITKSLGHCLGLYLPKVEISKLFPPKQSNRRANKHLVISVIGGVGGRRWAGGPGGVSFSTAPPPHIPSGLLEAPYYLGIETDGT